MLHILRIYLVIVTAPFHNIQTHVHVTILTIIHNNNHCYEYDWTPYQEKYKLDIDNPIKKDLTF